MIWPFEYGPVHVVGADPGFFLGGRVALRSDFNVVSRFIIIIIIIIIII